MERILNLLPRLALVGLLLVAAFRAEAADSTAETRAKARPKRMTPAERRELLTNLNKREPSPGALRRITNSAPKKVVGGPTNLVSQRINQALK
jgi:hypothetical protein